MKVLQKNDAKSLAFTIFADTFAKGRITALPKEGNTHPIPDDYYTKSICPSGGHGRGHRLALQNLPLVNTTVNR